MDKGAVYYARHEGLVVLRFEGNLRLGDAYNVTTSLDTFLDRLFEKADFDNMLLDLRDTKTIDSTNLGLLAKIANFMRQRFKRKATILSTNEDINETLESVGFPIVFNIVTNMDETEDQLEPLPKEAEEAKDFTHLVLQAHKALVALNDRNEETFKNLIDNFEDEL